MFFLLPFIHNVFGDVIVFIWCVHIIRWPIWRIPPAICIIRLILFVPIISIHIMHRRQGQFSNSSLLGWMSGLWTMNKLTCGLMPMSTICNYWKNMYIPTYMSTCHIVPNATKATVFSYLQILAQAKTKRFLLNILDLSQHLNMSPAYNSCSKVCGCNEHVKTPKHCIMLLYSLARITHNGVITATETKWN